MKQLLTVRQFSAAFPAFSEGALRSLIFLAEPKWTSRGSTPGNGFAPAIRRIGRRVYIDPQAFFECVEIINESASGGAR